MGWRDVEGFGWREDRESEGWGTEQGQSSGINMNKFFKLKVDIHRKEMTCLMRRMSRRTSCGRRRWKQRGRRKVEERERRTSVKPERKHDTRKGRKKVS